MNLLDCDSGWGGWFYFGETAYLFLFSGSVLCCSRTMCVILLVGTSMRKRFRKKGGNTSDKK